jgi:hypothetical protein
VAKDVFGSSKGHKLPGAMGAFGRRCKNRYGGVKPFRVEWNAVASQWVYTMTADVAKWVGRASRAANEPAPKRPAPRRDVGRDPRVRAGV